MLDDLASKICKALFGGEEEDCAEVPNVTRGEAWVSVGRVVQILLATSWDTI